jgi:hypothetical protein
MSEPWISLLAALVGAIVGGAASLAGTVLVNRMQMATNARMRLYDELLPRLKDAVDAVMNPLVPEPEDQAKRVMPELLVTVERASAIAGRKERSAVHKLALLWFRYSTLSATPPPNLETLLPQELLESINQSELTIPPPRGNPRPDTYAERKAEGWEALNKMADEIQALSDYLAAKLG